MSYKTEHKKFTMLELGNMADRCANCNCPRGMHRFKDGACPKDMTPGKFTYLTTTFKAK